MMELWIVNQCNEKYVPNKVFSSVGRYFQWDFLETVELFVDRSPSHRKLTTSKRVEVTFLRSQMKLQKVA